MSNVPLLLPCALQWQNLSPRQKNGACYAFARTVLRKELKASSRTGMVGRSPRSHRTRCAHPKPENTTALTPYNEDPQLCDQPKGYLARERAVSNTVEPFNGGSVEGHRHHSCWPFRRDGTVCSVRPSQKPSMRSRCCNLPETKCRALQSEARFLDLKTMPAFNPGKTLSSLSMIPSATAFFLSS